jgi:hypothetical protein
MTCGMMASPLIARTSSEHTEHIKIKFEQEQYFKKYQISWIAKMSFEI